jgi:hypothetical protein
MNYNLKFGEGKMIADECGISTNTFKKAIKGEINTPIAQLIRMHTEVVIRQREERVEALNKLLSKIKKGGIQ